MKPLLMLAMVGTPLLAGTAGLAQDVSDEELLASLEGVAPADVLENATLMRVTPEGAMETVREGSNGWTCLNPGTDPMCADAGGMEWMHALMSEGEASEPLGFVYMLLGDEGASNTDPFATEETEDNHWVVTGPHVMIVGQEARTLLEGHPREAEADPSRPYVMWAGTPHEHLMFPME